jgi:hypothetical protein
MQTDVSFLKKMDPFGASDEDFFPFSNKGTLCLQMR